MNRDKSEIRDKEEGDERQEKKRIFETSGKETRGKRRRENRKEKERVRNKR